MCNEQCAILSRAWSRALTKDRRGTTWPRALSGNFLRAVPAIDQEQHGHAHGQAIGDLFEHDGPFAIGDLAVDLDTAIDRARVHDEYVRSSMGEAGLGETEQIGVFANAWEHL